MPNFCRPTDPLNVGCPFGAQHLRRADVATALGKKTQLKQMMLSTREKGGESISPEQGMTRYIAEPEIISSSSQQVLATVSSLCIFSSSVM